VAIGHGVNYKNTKCAELVQYEKSHLDSHKLFEYYAKSIMRMADKIMSHFLTSEIDQQSKNSMYF
jgi:hypothetical protein